MSELPPERRFERYAELWAELNAVNALISDLEKRREEIKVQQRQLANAIVARKMDEIAAGKGDLPGKTE